MGPLLDGIHGRVQLLEVYAQQLSPMLSVDWRHHRHLPYVLILLVQRLLWGKPGLADASSSQLNTSIRASHACYAV